MDKQSIVRFSPQDEAYSIRIQEKVFALFNPEKDDMVLFMYAVHAATMTMLAMGVRSFKSERFTKK